MYVSDCEADDVIAYLAKYKFSEDDVTIVSSDKDFFQLLSNNVKMWNLNLKKLIDQNYVYEKYGIHDFYEFEGNIEL